MNSNNEIFLWNSVLNANYIELETFIKYNYEYIKNYRPIKYPSIIYAFILSSLMCNLDDIIKIKKLLCDNNLFSNLKSVHAYIEISYKSDNIFSKNRNISQINFLNHKVNPFNFDILQIKNIRIDKFIFDLYKYIVDLYCTKPIPPFKKKTVFKCNVIENINYVNNFIKYDVLKISNFDVNEVEYFTL